MVDTLQLIKTVVADGNSATMDTGTLTGDLDVLRVVVQIEGGGSGGCRMKFNSDGGNNYRRLFSENGGAKDGHNDGASGNIANMVGRTGRRSYSINTIYNISGKESSGYGNCITDGGNTGSANAPTRMEYAFKWANTAQITSIQIVSDSTNWASGSTLNVYAYSRADEEISDEKTTLADGTREATATKTAPTSGVLPTGTTTNDWTLVDATISSSNLNFNAGQQSTAVNGLYDLGSALSDEKWVVRFKYVISDFVEGNASNINAFVGLFSTTGNFNTTQDSINLAFTNWASNYYFWAEAEADGGIDESANSGHRLSTTPSETTYYVEIARTGTTTGKITLFSDSTYETELSSQTSFSTTLSSSITGLRYIGIKNRSNVPNLGAARWEGTISDIEVYDGVDAVVSTVSTAPPVGTRYEETNTRKIYRWADVGTKATANASNMEDSGSWSGDGSLEVDNGVIEVRLGGSNAGRAKRNYGTSNIDASKWVMRFKWKQNGDQVRTDHDMRCIIGLSSNDGSFGGNSPTYGTTSQDCVGMYMDVGHVHLNSTNGASVPSTIDSTLALMDYSLAPFTKYCEIIRDGDSFTLNIFDNSTFLGTKVSSTKTITGITGLAYIGGQAGWHGGAGGINADISEIEFYNGITVVQSDKQWKERGSA